MKIEGLEGEWRLAEGSTAFYSTNWNNPQYVRVIERIPEKSELEKWVIATCTGKDRDGAPSQYSIGESSGKWAGFRKALKIAESDCEHGCHQIIKALKDFAGIK